jgi:hypothetical protein
MRFLEAKVPRRAPVLEKAGLALTAALMIGTLSAQQPAKHLNPVIEKLAAGKPFIGFQTGDLSLENARALARTDIDYVYLEMEHGPMDFKGMHEFTVGMIDKATILKKGNRTWRSLRALLPMDGKERSGS